jgi:DNA-directed RNA polymerase specialized sigma24 family protein
MDRATALSRLPEAYAEALRLRDAGLSHAAIARRLGVPDEAMVLLLRLADAKLAHLMADDEEKAPEADLIPPPASPPEGTV